jgi:TonB family protein
MSPHIHILLPLGGTLLGLGLALALVRIKSLALAGYSRQTYRAIEGFDLKTGLLLAMVVLLLAASAPLVAKLLEPQSQSSDVIEIPIDRPIGPIVLPPPPPINPDAADNLSNLSAFAKAPTFGVPKPVPDAQASPEDDITPEDAVNLYARNATPDSVIKRLAQTDDGDLPEVGAFVPHDREPQAVHIARPVYPDICARAGAEGTAFVQILLNRRGEVVRVQVQRSSGNAALDEAALEAARLSRFTPAMQGDSPVSVWISMPFAFRLGR